jgi:hypothetical protein
MLHWGDDRRLLRAASRLRRALTAALRRVPEFVGKLADVNLLGGHYVQDQLHDLQRLANAVRRAHCQSPLQTIARPCIA